MTSTIEFRDLPSHICNWYDRGTSARRVICCQVRPIKRRGQIVGDEYIVNHTYGKDYWRQDEWNDWVMHKTSDDAAKAHGPVE